MKILISPKRVLRFFLYLIGILLLLNLAGLYSRMVLQLKYGYTLRTLFDFDIELNIPTFFSAVALLLSSIILSMIAWGKKKMDLSYFHWLGLAIVFLFLSIDEFAALHERLISPIRTMLNASGWLYYSWIIPYGGALFLLIIVYFRFWIRLPRETAILFGLSAALFVAGSIGLEMIGGKAC